MRIAVLTLFPSMFDAVLGESMLKLALEKALVSIEIHNLRNWGLGKRRTIDDRPYGGGPGMVIMPEPVFKAVEEIAPEEEGWRKILLTPQGRRYEQKIAIELASEKKLLLVCGHYEGFDERIRKGIGLEEISIGDYVTTGGELPAMVVIDTIVRQIPGVLGNESSPAEESFVEGLIEYPQYTRPPKFRSMEVPEVLLSGNHAEIAKWRRDKSIERTRMQRPDLLENEQVSGGDSPS